MASKNAVIGRCVRFVARVRRRCIAFTVVEVVIVARVVVVLVEVVMVGDDRVVGVGAGGSKLRSRDR